MARGARCTSAESWFASTAQATALRRRWAVATNGSAAAAQQAACLRHRHRCADNQAAAPVAPPTARTAAAAMTRRPGMQMRPWKTTLPTWVLAALMTAGAAGPAATAPPATAAARRRMWKRRAAPAPAARPSAGGRHTRSTRCCGASLGLRWATRGRQRTYAGRVSRQREPSGSPAVLAACRHASGSRPACSATCGSLRLPCRATINPAPLVPLRRPR